jgi:hypothetical protein
LIKIYRRELFILEQFDEHGYPVIGSEDEEEVKKKEIDIKTIKYKILIFSYQKWMKTKQNLHLIFHRICLSLIRLSMVD